jgi:3-deoxy-D-manno-octulosonic-acid transferase
MNPIGWLMWWTWAAIGWVVYVVSWPFIRLLGMRGGDSAENWRERLGILGEVPRGAVWIHGASVGEVSALAPFLGELVRYTRKERGIISSMTATGKRRARSAYRHCAVAFPMDAVPAVRRAFRQAEPRVVIIAETELWPAFIMTASRCSRLAWVNGRISDRSFPRYRLFLRPLLRLLFSRFELLCVISKQDADRVVALGAPRSRVRVTGNLKADLVVPGTPLKGIPRARWFVAGSTRPGEEAAILEGFALSRKRIPGLHLCIAPRHLDRVDEVVLMAERAGFRVARRSDGPAKSGLPEVLVLDTHGELLSVYRKAEVAFVGGTLVPVGGHNVMEPAVAGVPVLFGPHTANVREEAEGLVKSGGGFRVSGSGTIAASLLHLMSSRLVGKRAGARARAFVKSRQGVARRVAALFAREGLL